MQIGRQKSEKCILFSFIDPLYHKTTIGLIFVSSCLDFVVVPAVNQVSLLRN